MRNQAGGRIKPIQIMGLVLGAWTVSWALLGMPGPVHAEQVEVVDGVTHVRNPATPSEGTVTLHLQEQWRVGDDPDDVLLGIITDAGTDGEGNVYLLDRQLSHVEVFGPDGRHRRTLGREGDGPGEFRFPGDMVVLADGRVAVTRAMPGAVVLLEPDGTPAGMVHLGGDDLGGGNFSFLDEVHRADDGLVVAGRSMRRTEEGFERTLFVGALDMNGHERYRLLERTAPDPIMTRKFVERDEYYVARGGLAVDDEGRIYAASQRDRYAIEVYGPDGTLQRVIERDFKPRKRTQEEKDEVGQNLVAVVNGERIRFDIVAEDYPPCIQGMRAMPDGELWVVTDPTSLGQSEGVVRTYDVFDAAGRFVRQVVLAGPGDADEDGWLLLGPDRVLRIKGLQAAARAMTGSGPGDENEEVSEAEPLEVICYSIVPA